MEFLNEYKERAYKYYEDMCDGTDGRALCPNNKWVAYILGEDPMDLYQEFKERFEHRHDSIDNIYESLANCRTACDYFGVDHSDCENCPANTQDLCVEAALYDVMKRTRAVVERNCQ